MILISIIDLPLEEAKNFIENLRKERKLCKLSKCIDYIIVSWKDEDDNSDIISVSLFCPIFDTYVNIPPSLGGIQIMQYNEESWKKVKNSYKKRNNRRTILKRGTI